MESLVSFYFTFLHFSLIIASKYHDLQLSGDTKAIDFVSRLCEAGTTGEARKSALTQGFSFLLAQFLTTVLALTSLDSEYAARFSDLSIRKKELQDSKYKWVFQPDRVSISTLRYENLTDIAESLGHLQDSIDDNRRQVIFWFFSAQWSMYNIFQLKHSETSLTSTGNVLEYDAAKTRSHKLIQIITVSVYIFGTRPFWPYSHNCWPYQWAIPDVVSRL